MERKNENEIKRNFSKIQQKIYIFLELQFKETMMNFLTKRRLMKPSKYEDECKNILKWELVIARQVDTLTSMVFRYSVEIHHRRKSQIKINWRNFSLEKFKKNCGELRKIIDAVTNHLYLLGRADTSDDLSLFSYVATQKALYKFSRILLEELNSLQSPSKEHSGSQNPLPFVRFYLIFSHQWKQLTDLKGVRAGSDREIELVCEELKQIIEKIKAMNLEQKGVGSYYNERIRKLIIELSKRENKTLNIEKFETVKVNGEEKEVIGFKGEIHVHILFSILNDYWLRISELRENSKGKLDARFGEQTAAEIRTKIRKMSEHGSSWLYDQYRADPERSIIAQSIPPPAEVIRHFKIRKLDKYLELVKNAALEQIKEVFSNNFKFFNGIYGKQFNINLKLFLVTFRDSYAAAFVLPERTVFSGRKSDTGQPCFNEVYVMDPQNIEIFVSIQFIAGYLMNENRKQLEQTIFHEIVHWFTRHFDKRTENRLGNLFSEGIASFAEYIANPKKFLIKRNLNSVLVKFYEVVKQSGSIKDIENFVISVDLSLQYSLGAYMWVVIYAYKIRKEKGRECFDSRLPTNANTLDPAPLIRKNQLPYFLNEERIIELAAEEKATRWLSAFTKLMTPAMFLKEYVEAAKKMKLHSIFSETAGEFLIEAAKEEKAKRKEAIYRRRAM